MAMKMKKLDEKLGEFKVIKDLGMKNSGQPNRYRCAIVECPYCGKHKEVDANKYKNKAPKSCGCKSSEFKSLNSTQRTHGGVGTRLYIIWEGMRRRCLRPNKKEAIIYANVTICREWDDFAIFRNWANNNGYKDILTLDRINGAKGYSPDNCRWASKTTQASNRVGKKSKVLPKGVHKNGNNFASRITVNKKQLSLGTFKTIDGAKNAYNNFIKNNSLEDSYPLSQ